MNLVYGILYLLNLHWLYTGFEVVVSALMVCMHSTKSTSSPYEVVTNNCNSFRWLKHIGTHKTTEK